MKKIITVLLSVLYLVSSSGATIHIHYCMGKMADWSLSNNQTKTCSKCGMEKKDKNDNGCCKHEHKFLKNNSDQKIVESSFQLIMLQGIALVPDYTEMPFSQISSETEENPNSNSPPRTQAIPVYIRNCVFRI